MKLETRGCQSIGSANEKLSASMIQDFPITFSWIGLIILPLLQKPVSKKIGALIRCRKSLSPEIVLYL